AVAYMPGFGVSVAATTLVGQAIGAERRDLARSFARLSVAIGMVIMAVMGCVLFFAAPVIMGMLTPVPEVQQLGVDVLRIEAFAEPLFAATLVSAGALRGAGDTLVPTLFQIATIWGLRLTASALLAPLWGLQGVWIAMAFELCIRGILFLVRLLRGSWLKRAALTEAFH
ncbi:MAG: hypothetical protein IJ125_06010, partial [Atopobiaceae bacterium]|nr:hypothetical protein [Atopobiaceae bacterium]